MNSILNVLRYLFFCFLVGCSLEYSFAAIVCGTAALSLAIGLAYGLYCDLDRRHKTAAEATLRKLHQDLVAVQDMFLEAGTIAKCIAAYDLDRAEYAEYSALQAFYSLKRYRKAEALAQAGLLDVELVRKLLKGEEESGQ